LLADDFSWLRSGAPPKTVVVGGGAPVQQIVGGDGVALIG
jgi:hypothetical protein